MTVGQHDVGLPRKIMYRAVGWLLILYSLQVLSEEPSSITGPFLDQKDVTWKVNEFNVARWKTLVGGIEGGQIARDDIQFGIWELAPKAIYHSHKHEVPEIYFIISGKALWTVDDETREVGPGMTIYTQPGAVHKMVNLTSEPVRANWVWWAPDGDKTVFFGDYAFTEPRPDQPEGAGFKKDDSQRLY